MVKEGWKRYTIGELGTFAKGSGISREQSDTGKLPAVRYGELYTTHNYYVREYGSHISSEIASKALKIKYGKILFTCSGETKEEIGKCAAIVTDGEAYAGGDLIVLTPTIHMHPLFLGYALNMPSVVQQRAQMAQGDAIVHISVDSIKSIEFDSPDYPEQCNIAQALSDIDELIFSLEKLIDKKKNIQEGAMQELLTQKKEFPFMDNSEVDYRIGDIGDFYSGLTGKSKADFGTGNAKYITFLNVLSNSIIDISILESVNVEDDESQNVARLGDLFFNTSSETPEEVGMCAVLLDYVRNVYLNSFCFGYRLKSKDIDPLFFSYYFNSQEGRKIMSVLAQGATRYNLSKSYFANTVVSFPKYEKQKLIAQILHDMDTEIESLQSKLEKYIQMKSGMMDELLTGKVRLV